ncbi:MAG: hypothetical protein WAO61_10020 [Solirubrobacterales bacterium]
MFLVGVKPRLMGAALLAFVVLIALAFVGPIGSARADVYPTFTTSMPNTKLGAHSDYTVDMSFAYDDQALLDPPNDPSDDATTEDLKSVVVDSPAGLIGNPNAIPYADRCPIGDFNTPRNGTLPDGSFTNRCSDKALVGKGELTLILHDFSNAVFTPVKARIFLIKTDPEVPATLGLYTKVISGLAAVTVKMQIAPDTNGDFHLRTTLLDDIPRIDLPDLANGGTLTTGIRVDNMKITFFGSLADGTPFLTNPTRCEPWTTTLYAAAYDRRTNATEAPTGDSIKRYVKAPDQTITPDCSDPPAFDLSGTAAVSTPKRGVSPDLDVIINQPGLMGPGSGTVVPKRITTTLPPSLNLDVTQLGRICSDADFAANRCPLSMRVGTVDVETPLIATGLHGYVYLLPGQTTVLPDLGLDIRGPVNFHQRGKNKFVGPHGNQIQTTFDDIPQVGFSKLTVRINGGDRGLLKTLDCPTTKATPEGGDFSFAFSSYAGQSSTSAGALAIDGCQGIRPLRKMKCVAKTLKILPAYQSAALVKSSSLYVNNKLVQKVTKAPFGFKKPVRALKKVKLKPGKLFRVVVRATYSDGAVKKVRASFKRCR